MTTSASKVHAPPGDRFAVAVRNAGHSFTESRQSFPAWERRSRRPVGLRRLGVRPRRGWLGGERRPGCGDQAKVCPVVTF
jgi:hypothetical protein